MVSIWIEQWPYVNEKYEISFSGLRFVCNILKYYWTWRHFAEYITCQCCPHIETSQLISKSIEWFLYEDKTGVYLVNTKNSRFVNKPKSPLGLLTDNACRWEIFCFWNWIFYDNKRTLYHQQIYRLIIFPFQFHSNNLQIQLFDTTGLFLYCWKHKRIKGFLVFSRGIKRDQWHEMGQKHALLTGSLRR